MKAQGSKEQAAIRGAIFQVHTELAPKFKAHINIKTENIREMCSKARNSWRWKNTYKKDKHTEGEMLLKDLIDQRCFWPRGGAVSSLSNTLIHSQHPFSVCVLYCTFLVDL